VAAGALLITGLATVVVATAGTAAAQQVTIDSDKYINVTPGKTVKVGYAFEYVAGASTVVKNTVATLQVSCKEKTVTPTQSTVVVPIPDATYPAPAPNDGKFVPSGSKSDEKTFQASFVVGDYCKGGEVVLGKKDATKLTTDLYSSNSTQKIYVQWHFGAVIVSDGKDGDDEGDTVEGSWKKGSVTPEPLEALGADISVTKSETTDPVRPGENIVYTITAVNNSQVLDATNVVVTDVLDASTTFVSAPGCTRSGVTLTCSVGTLVKKGTKTFTVTVATSPLSTTDAFTGSGAQAGGFGTTCPTSDVCNKVSISALTKDTDTTNNAYFQPTNLTRPGVALITSVTDASGDRVGALGEVLTYGFSVSNTGALPLSNVKISDNKLGLSNADCVASLAIGATTTCPLLTSGRTYTVSAGDITNGSVANTATVTATPAVGAAITGSDSVTISSPAKPALTLVKTVADGADAGEIANLGETLTYGFTVKNTGNVALGNVTVTDAMVGLGNAACTSSLAIGASVACLPGRTYTVTSTDIGQGVVTNTATATSTGSAGGAATAAGTATIPTEAARPALLLTKSVSDSPADGDSIGSVGETLTSGFVVTNTGNVPLTDVTVTDTTVGLDRAVCTSTLPAGGSVTCPSRPTHVVTSADIERGSFTNTAVARGATTGGTAVSDDDTATIATPPAPGLSLSKSVVDGPDTGSIANLDEELSYTFRVTNSGNVPLTDVTVTDAKLDLSAAPCVATLAPGATATCPTRKYTVIEDDVEAGSVINTATAGATYAGTALKATDTATISTETAAPVVAITKTVADSGTDGDSIGSLGETLTYSFRITNKGNVALTNVTITDPLLGLDKVTCVAKLSVRASTSCPQLSARTYVVKAADIERGSVSNTATAAGSGSKQRVSASDTATIATPAVPAISLAKSVRDADGNATGALGEVLTYAFKVTNTGNVPLSGIALTDPRLGLDSAPCVATLPVGASADCTGGNRTYTVTSADIAKGSIDNTARVIASGPGSSSVEAQDTTSIPAEKPVTGVAVTKTVADADGDRTASLGEKLIYRFSVTNTGNVALSNITISDALLGLDRVSCATTLAERATVTCLGDRDYVVKGSDIDAGQVVNDATAAATPATGGTVTGSSSVTIPAPASPAIVLTKSVTDSPDADAVGSVGEQLTYTFTVTNTGNQPLGKLTLTDKRLGLADASCVTGLAVGQTTTCLGAKTYQVTADDVSRGVVNNTATVSGTSPSGKVVSATDTATMPTVSAAPAVGLDKRVADSDDAGDVASAGEKLTYTFTVVNNGNLPLTKVTITDAMLGLDGAACASDLPVGASATCLTQTYTVTDQDTSRTAINNTASASASGNGITVGASDTASIGTETTAASAMLVKSVRDSADKDTIGSLGEQLRYSFKITNNGDVPLTGVRLTDALLGLNEANCGVPTLAVGASTTCPSVNVPIYTVREQDVERGRVDNTAAVIGNAPSGRTVTYDASATIKTGTAATPPPSDNFDFNWTYPTPSCDALTVTYPADIPDGQSNDVNIRILTDRGRVTLNYHLDEGFWDGTQAFAYREHPRWPVGVTDYTVEWTQVAGTNYHWEGAVVCRIGSDGAPVTVSDVNGFRAGTVTVKPGRAAPTDSITVSQLGFASIDLERRTAEGWRFVKTLADNGRTAKITYPRQRRKGVYTYRVVIDATDTVAGYVSPVLKVRVRR